MRWLECWRDNGCITDAQWIFQDSLRARSWEPQFEIRSSFGVHKAGLDFEFQADAFCNLLSSSPSSRRSAKFCSCFSSASRSIFNCSSKQKIVPSSSVFSPLSFLWQQASAWVGPMPTRGMPHCSYPVRTYGRRAGVDSARSGHGSGWPSWTYESASKRRSGGVTDEGRPPFESLIRPSVLCSLTGTEMAHFSTSTCCTFRPRFA